MGEGLFSKELLHKVIIDFSNGFVDVVHQFIDVAVSIGHGDLSGFSVLICICLVVKQIHEDSGLSFLDDGKNYRADSGSEMALKIGEGLLEIGVLNTGASHEEQY